MLDFTYGDYVYFNENNEILKYYHDIIIKKKDHRKTITSKLTQLEERLKRCQFFK